MFLEQVPLILCSAPHIVLCSHIVPPMCTCAIFFEQESAAYFSSGDSAAAFAGHKFPGFNEKAVGQSKIYTSQLLLLGKFEYGGGPIFKVVLEC